MSIPQTHSNLPCLMLVLCAAAGLAGDVQVSGPVALPESNEGIAAKYPGDQDIDRDPSVLFHDDFESGTPQQKWDNVFHADNIRIVDGRANVHGGKKALEFTVPKQEAEVSNSLVKHLKAGHDVIFIRYYSKFGKGFDQLGSSHNGAVLSALSPGLPFATPGILADGKNKFIASFEDWRDDAATPSPGELNVYCYHPEQRSDYGDHFFPSGKVLPFSYKPGAFGEHFTARPDITPELDRWHCFEFMLKANTPGQRDGRIAGWLDGRLVADFGNLRLRDTDALKINYAQVDLHIKSNTIRENKKWYDDVVVATSYIGPFVEPK